MAIQATFSDVIEQLRTEGQLTRDVSTESTRTLEIDLTGQTIILNQMLKLMQAQEERFKLARAGQDKGTDSKPSTESEELPDAKPRDDSKGLGLGDILSAFGALGSAFSALGGFGTLATLAAGTIGATLGIVVGQFKAIQLIFPKTVGAIITQVTNFGNTIKALLTTAADAITKGIRTATTSVTGAISGFGTWMKGLFSSAGTAVNKLGKAGEFFTKSISTIADTIGKIGKAFLSVGKFITGAVTTVSGLGSAFSSIMTPLKSFIGTIKSVAGVVGKLFVPFTIVLTLFDTITAMIDGYAEGGILGALEGGITGFFNSLIFGPLDMLKNLVSWIAGKMGFENFAAILDSFSFSELFSGMVSSIFGAVKGVFSVITDLFSFGEEDMTALGLLGKFTDLVYAPINMAINFVRGLFGFEETDEPFKLQDWITQTITDIWNFFTDFIPSMEDIKAYVLNQMPDWMRKLVGAPERTATEIVDEKVKENKEELTAAQDRVARSAAGENVYYGREGVGREEDEAKIRELQSTVEAQNPQIAVMDRELETLRAEKERLIAEASKPRPRGGSVGKADTSEIDAQIAEYEALKAKTINTQPTAELALPAPPAQTTNTSSTYIIGGEPVIAGVPLSAIQLAAIEMAMSMGNKLPAEVMTQYNNQKSGIVAPVAPVAPVAAKPASPTPPDLLQSKISTSSTYSIGGEPVVAGVPLSSVQMAAIEMSLSMGNKLPTEVMAQYNKQKSGTIAQVAPPAAVTAAPPAVTPPDLLQSKISAPVTYSVGGEKVIPGAALSSNQMTAIEMSLLMGSKPPAEIMTQYNKQKSARGGPTTTTAPDLLESKISPVESLTAENAAAVTGATPSSALIMKIADTTIAAQQGRMSMIEQTETSRSGNPTIIVNAPTVAPVNNNVTGPTNISNQRVTSIGSGSSSGGAGLARFAN